MYSDFKEVIFIPGTTQFFDLKAYKNRLGKPYSQIVFYLCTETDLNYNQSHYDSLGDISNNAFDAHSEEERQDYLEIYNKSSNRPKIETPPAPADSSYLQIGLDTDDIPKVPQLYPFNEPEVFLVEKKVNHAESTQPPSSTSQVSYEDKLRTLQDVYRNNSEPFKLSVRRRKIWLDTCQKLKRAFKTGMKTLSIEFIGEDANDAGGPLKEFFSVLFDDVKKYLLCSSGSSFTFKHDIELLRNGDFSLLGSMIALALLNGCAGPRCLAAPIVGKLFGRDEPSKIEDVPDLEVQIKLKELNDTINNEEFAKSLENFPQRFEAGVTRVKVDFTEKSSFIEKISEHYCISTCIEELQDVVKGLDFLGLKNLRTNFCLIKQKTVTMFWTFSKWCTVIHNWKKDVWKKIFFITSQTL